MKVCHVSNATRVWVSLLEHVSYTGNKTSIGLHSDIKFKKLSLDLTQYYSIPENREFIGKSLSVINTKLLDCSSFYSHFLIFLF